MLVVLGVAAGVFVRVADFRGGGGRRGADLVGSRDFWSAVCGFQWRRGQETGSTAACAAGAIAIAWAGLVGFIMLRATHFRIHSHTDQQHMRLTLMGC